MENSKDSVETMSVEEHFKLIIKDNSVINSRPSRITIDDLPDWFDKELFERGQAYYRNNILGITITYLLSLIAVFAIPSISVILTFTKQSSTPCIAFVRYFRTLLYMYDLHFYDAMDPSSRLYDAISSIRQGHSSSSARSVRNNYSGIYHRDMAFTQSCLVSYALVNPELMSLTNTMDDRKSFLHFWRIIGHLLGIPDKLNVCRENEQETLLLCRKITYEVFRKHLEERNEDFFKLADATVDGVQSVIPLIDTDMILSLLYKIHGLEYKTTMELKTRCYLNLMRGISYLIGLPVIGNGIRIFFNVFLRVHFWYYQRWPFYAQMKYGKENTKIKMYPYNFH